MVLYEMFTRQLPFHGVTRADTMVAILEREPAPLFAGSENFQPALLQMQRVVSKALRKEAEERYQSTAEMLVDLKTITQQPDTGAASGEQSAIGPLTNATRAATSRRYRFFKLSAAVLLAVVMVGTFLYLRSGQRTRFARAPAFSFPTIKLYTEMSQAEQLAFVDQQEQRISAMMGDRPVRLNDEALRAIKTHVDRYAARRASDKPGDESLMAAYARAVPLVPMIARAFAARKIPIVIGIYLPMIESAYRPCFENSIGARGMFQFLPQTAEQYGVARADMCDADKMAPAAAHYIADRMAELGDDSQSMTLVLLSYNSGPDPVRDALRRLRETDANYERNFWTLYANRDKLDDGFRNESAGYVPEFFAAAIIGENPRNFDLQIPALSTLAKDGG